MSKSITISLSDEAYAALQRASERTQQPVEEVAAASLNERFGGVHVATAEELEARDQLIAELIARGVVTDPKSIPPYPGIEDLPPRGTPEREQFEEELYEELGEAFRRSGLSILDLIERR